MTVHPAWITPDWPAPAGVHALITTRAGGVSAGAYAAAGGCGGLNVGLGSGDAPEAVLANRARLRTALPAEPRWLNQVHGAAVVDAGAVVKAPAADASFSNTPGVVCVVLIADCMPVLLSDSAGRCVAVAHAGWRGLAAGVIQATARAIRRSVGEADAEVVAYLGPAIGPAHFEVGAEVLEAMTRGLPHASAAFIPRDGKYLADLSALARQALGQVGVARIHGGTDCTYSDPARFYSFRRDGVTGRHAALIWLDGERIGLDRDKHQVTGNGV